MTETSRFVRGGTSNVNSRAGNRSRATPPGTKWKLTVGRKCVGPACRSRASGRSREVDNTRLETKGGHAKAHDFGACHRRGRPWVVGATGRSPLGSCQGLTPTIVCMLGANTRRREPFGGCGRGEGR